MKFQLKFKPIKYTNKKVIIIDQTLLPQKLKYETITSYKKMGEAIKKLKVRGAPLIGISAAYGILLGINTINTDKFNIFYNNFKKVKDYLASTRPTAVNLFYALNRMETTLLKNKNKSIKEIKKILTKEAENIYKEDLELSYKIGKAGSKLIKNGDIILTHCNAGGLATSGLGTALAVLFVSHQEKKKFKVFVDETRPLLQGARLTTWELLQYNIDTTLITDNMAAFTIKNKKITKIIVGADRIAANGDTANKIGTLNLGILAKYYKIPLYIAAPSTTFDFNIKSGKDIPIEERGREEVIKFRKCPSAPENVNVYSPAFDITPANLIAGFITEKGVITPPYKKNLLVLK